MTSHDDDFTPTAEERARLEGAPAFIRDAPEEHRRVLAWQMMQLMARAYREGDITLPRAQHIVWACALHSPTLADHIQLTARLARKAQLQPPVKNKRPDGRRRETVIKRAAVLMIDWLHAVYPDEPLVPQDNKDGTTKVLADTLAWLTTLGLIVKPITPGTLYFKWYLPTKRDMLQEADTKKPR